MLIQHGHNIFIYDNLLNSHVKVINDIQNITKQKVNFFEGDILDQDLLTSVIASSSIDIVIHFAGLKSVGESSKTPLEYYNNNVSGTISLLKAMKINNVKSIVFSSSATVYGAPKFLPITEKHPLNPNNPYGNSKLIIEKIFSDLAKTDKGWSVVCLRYFNPVGAHSSGLIGENPKGTPNNLMPIIANVALQKISKLSIYGNNYPTIDGTGVRDYIHISDLSEGHLSAINYILKNSNKYSIFNLGTGIGTSVLELVSIFSNVSGKKIPFKIVSPRKGDVASCFTSNLEAKKKLGWQPNHGVESMCESAWQYYLKNDI